ALDDATPVSPLPTAARGTFRLAFADGSTLKGRVLQTERQAAAVERWVAALGPGAAAGVRARYGRALLEEWVAGTPLDDSPATERHLRACGRLLARIHRGAPEQEVALADGAEPDA